MRMRQAKRGEQDEQVASRRCRAPYAGPCGENSHSEVEAMRSLRNMSASRRAREQAAAVDPGTEIGRDGDVRRGGDDAVGKRRCRARQLIEDLAEAGLRRHRRAGVDGEPLGHRNAASRLMAARPLGAERHAIEKAPQLRRGRAPGLRTAPIRGPGRTPSARAEPRSAPWSSARHDCPCARQAAGRSP